MRYYEWEEYKPNRFRRWDKEAQLVDVEELAKEMYEDWKLITMNNEMDNWEIVKNQNLKTRWRKLAQAISNNPNLLKLVRIK